MKQQDQTAAFFDLADRAGFDVVRVHPLLSSLNIIFLSDTSLQGQIFTLLKILSYFCSLWKQVFFSFFLI